MSQTSTGSSHSDRSTPVSSQGILSGQVIQVPTPAMGQSVTVQSSPGGKLEFAFDPTQNTSYERADNSLVFKSADGGTVTVKDFFSVGDDKLPTLALPDGTVVSTDFLTAAGVDLSTAAGPNATPPGSGGTNYHDAAGTLLGGVDRLGDQSATDGWNTGRATVEYAAPAARMEEGIATLDTGGATPVPGPVPDPLPHSRAILASSAEHPSMTIYVEDAAGNPVLNPVSISFAFADNTYFTIPAGGFDPATGKLTLALTPAGINALAGGTPLNDLLTVTVDGRSYEVHLVGQEPGEGYISQDEAGLQKEWYASDSAVQNTTVQLAGVHPGEISIDSKEQFYFTEDLIPGTIGMNDGGNGDGNGDATPDEFSGFVGVMNSTLDANGGIVRISASNVEDAPDSDAKMHSLGVYGKGTAHTTTITGQTVEILAETSDAHGTPQAHSWQGAAIFAEGIHSDNSQISVAGQNISIGAEVHIESEDAQSYLYAKATGILSGDSSTRYVSERDEPVSNVSITGAGDKANTFSISASVEFAEDAAQHGTNSREGTAIGIDAGAGTLSMTGGAANDIFSIEATVSSYLGEFAADYNGESHSATGIYAWGKNGSWDGNGDYNDESNQIPEQEAVVVLDGGAGGGDVLKIHAETTVDATKADYGYLGQQAYGISAGTLANITLKNFEEVTIEAVNKMTAPDNPSPWFSPWGAAAAVYVGYDSKLLITNTENMQVNLESSGGGIVVNGGSTAEISSEKSLTLNIHADGTDDNDAAIYAGGKVDIKAGTSLNLLAQGETAVKVWGELNITGGTEADTITLDGKVQIDDGELNISTGDGGDALTIKDDVYSHVQSSLNVDMGTGNDTVELSGQQTAQYGGSLSYELGSGNDSFSLNGGLLLYSPHYYSPSSFSANGGEGDDSFSLMGNTDTLGVYHSVALMGETSLDGGIGDDCLTYGFNGTAAGLASLTAAAGTKVVGFEHLILDMSDGVAGTLDMSELGGSIGTLQSVAGSGNKADIFLKSGDADSVNLDGWTAQSATKTLDGITYQLYQNGGDLETQIYLQTTLATV